MRSRSTCLAPLRACLTLPLPPPLPLQVYGRSFMPEHKGSKDSVTGAKKYKRDPMMNTRGSKFVKFQEARIQEMADEVGGGAGLCLAVCLMTCLQVLPPGARHGCMQLNACMHPASIAGARAP